MALGWRTAFSTRLAAYSMIPAIADAIRGTVNRTLAVAVAEVAMIGIGFDLAGVPHPLLFAVLTMAFAILPFGAWAAFTAAALVLLLHVGTLLAAAGVFGFGATVMLIGDNFVQPALVGGTTRLPFLLAAQVEWCYHVAAIGFRCRLAPDKQIMFARRRSVVYAYPFAPDRKDRGHDHRDRALVGSITIFDVMMHGNLHLTSLP